jgi:3-hydroxyacyl-[acyl-carrier-protein] dehydratase
VKGGEPLSLGPDVIQRLIPHRRPLLMVDRVLAYRHRPRPVLWARRQISANEDVFEGHFPGISLWPGAYTIEGLGQSTLLCAIIAYVVERRTREGGNGTEFLDTLRALERSYTRPLSGAPPPVLDTPHPKLGMAGHVDVKFIAPVFAGCELHYRVELTHVLDTLARFDVVAEVAGTDVARGTMTGAIDPSMVLPAP